MVGEKSFKCKDFNIGLQKYDSLFHLCVQNFLVVSSMTRSTLYLYQTCCVRFVSYWCYPVRSHGHDREWWELKWIFSTDCLLLEAVLYTMFKVWFNAHDAVQRCTGLRAFWGQIPVGVHCGGPWGRQNIHTVSTGRSPSPPARSACLREIVLRDKA